MTSTHASEVDEKPTDPPEKKSKIPTRLGDYFPSFSALSVALTLVIFAIIFIPIGAVVIVASDNSPYVRIRYDDANHYKYRVGDAGVYPHEYPFDGKNFSTGQIARIFFRVPKTLVAPVYFQYELHWFYQGYRQYQVSIDDTQVRGGTKDLIDNCKPFRNPGEVSGEAVQGYYNPCGALAWSMFNDSLGVYSVPDGTIQKLADADSISGKTNASSRTPEEQAIVDDAAAWRNTDSLPSGATLICDGSKFTLNGTNLDEANNLCHKKGIALSIDVTNRHREPQSAKGQAGPMWTYLGEPTSTSLFLQHGYYYGEQGHRIPYVMDEDFMVWTRPGNMPRQYKIYRVIDSDLVAGEYMLNALELYDVTSFGGEKHVTLAVRSWLGGRHFVLGILLVVFGSISFVSSITIILINFIVR